MILFKLLILEALNIALLNYCSCADQRLFQVDGVDINIRRKNTNPINLEDLQAITLNIESNSRLIYNDNQFALLASLEKVQKLNFSPFQLTDFLEWPKSNLNDCLRNGMFKCRNEVQVALRNTSETVLLCGLKYKQQTCEVVNIADGKRLDTMNGNEKMVQRLVSKREHTIAQPHLQYSQLYYYNNNEEQNLVWKYNTDTYKLTASPVTSYVDGARFYNIFTYGERVYYIYTVPQITEDANFRVEAIETYISQFCANETNDMISSFTRFKLQCFLPKTQFHYYRFTKLEFITKPIKSNIYSNDTKQRQDVLFAVYKAESFNDETSVLCAFDMKEIENNFINNEFEKSNEPYLYPKPFQKCNEYEPKVDNKDFIYRLLTDIIKKKKYNLVNPINKAGLFYNKNSIKSVQIDNRQDSNDIIYLATSEGHILKLTTYDTTDKRGLRGFYLQLVLIEEFRIFSNESIEALLINYETNRMIVSSGNKIVSFDLNTCYKYKSCNRCVNAQDPSCSWNSANKKCEFLKKNGLQDVVNGSLEICYGDDYDGETTTATTDETESETHRIQCKSTETNTVLIILYICTVIVFLIIVAYLICSKSLFRSRVKSFKSKFEKGKKFEPLPTRQNYYEPTSPLNPNKIVIDNGQFKNAYHSEV